MFDISWFEEVYDKEYERKQLTFLFRKFQDYLEVYDFITIDEILKQAEFERMTPTTMMAVIRYTCCAKHILEQWHPACQRAYDVCKNEKGEEAERIFMGLLDGINK